MATTLFKLYCMVFREIPLERLMERIGQQQKRSFSSLYHLTSGSLGNQQHVYSWNKGLCRFLSFGFFGKKPVFHYKDEKFADVLRKGAPILSEVYSPTSPWGYSGHCQTIYFGLNRRSGPWPKGKRYTLTAPDGATLVYDVFESTKKNSTEDDITILISPGMCNTSRTNFVRSVVNHVQKSGFRCVVFNLYIGTLSTVEVTSPRLFTIGGTSDFELMLHHFVEEFPHTKVLLVGFSLGANIMVKYLGEKSNVPSAVYAGISICNAYDGYNGMHYLLQWGNFRRIYNYFLTFLPMWSVKKHKAVLLSKEAKEKYQLVEKDIFSARFLDTLDEAYFRRVAGYSSLEDYYKKDSCLPQVKKITVPMIYINAKDDPLIVEPLLKPIIKHAETQDEVLYVQLQHGGHLGFANRGFFIQEESNWIARAVAEMTKPLLSYSSSSKFKTKSNL